MAQISDTIWHIVYDVRYKDKATVNASCNYFFDPLMTIFTVVPVL